MLSIVLFCCNFVSAESKPKPASKPAKEKIAVVKTADSAHLKSPETPTEDVMVLFYEQGEKISVWMHGQKGNQSIKKSDALWFEQGFASPAGDGFLYTLVNGSSFYTATKPAKALPLEEALTKSTGTPKGYEWLVTQRRGQFVPMLTTPNGAKVRLKMSKSQPSEPMWLAAKNIPERGAVAPALKLASWSSGPIPTTAKAIKPKKETSLEATWVKDLTKIRGGKVKIVHNISLDLDGDKQAEALICVSGGKGYPCYIADKESELHRYHNLGGITTASATAAAPFELDGKTYIAHQKATKSSTIQQHIRFDGKSYLLETVR